MISYQKSKIVTHEEVERFINDTSDDKYLIAQVATIFGLFGACRGKELYNLLTGNIELAAKLVNFRIANIQSKIVQRICIVGNNIDFCCKYIALRPSVIPHLFE